MILIYVCFYGAYLILYFVLSWGHEASFRYIQRKYYINLKIDLQADMAGVDYADKVDRAKDGGEGG